jgi:hypothetical protein
MSLSALRTLYFNATKATIQRDLTRAIDLFKALPNEEERDKAAVYMDGLSQMRSEWGVRPSGASGQPGRKHAPGAPSKKLRR